MQYITFDIKNDTTQIEHCSACHFLWYAHFSYVKCLFTNIEKQWTTLKSSLLFKKMKTLRENSPRNLTIQNVKFSGYYFYMITNIWSDFQICVSVPSSQKLLQTQQMIFSQQWFLQFFYQYQFYNILTKN